MMLLSKFEVLSMLCNIKSLTSRCLTDGGHRWISVSQNIVTADGWERRGQSGAKAKGDCLGYLDWSNNYLC
jgi:hypothetical protein